jgi:hypothetical protein
MTIILRRPLAMKFANIANILVFLHISGEFLFTYSQSYGGDVSPQGQVKVKEGHELFIAKRMSDNYAAQDVWVACNNADPLSGTRV